MEEIIILYLILGVLVPFLGTSIGSSFVIFCKKNTSDMKTIILSGVSAGVMLAASIWSLLIPAIDTGTYGYIKASIGLFLGILVFLLIDKFVNYINNKTSNLPKKKGLMFTTITLHNIPEGMAVGIALASGFSTGNYFFISSAFLVSLGIAIQNIPEGAIISLPLHEAGYKKSKAFFYGVLTGAVEPIFAIITILATQLVIPLMPYLLAFASGAMIYVVIKEMIPENVMKSSSFFVLAFTFGFLIMMILDNVF